nr:phosphatase PAP2 family protein [Ardenticatena sp.]
MHEWGYDIILALQQLRTPWLDLLFETVTWTGNEVFYLIFMPLVYWGVHPLFGMRLFLVFMLTGALNTLAKITLAQPRPSPERVLRLVEAEGFGFPSGHAQNAVVVWGWLAAQSRHPWAYIAAGGMAVLVGLSRIYLGVHFPHDVLGGWLLGLVVLWLAVRFETPVRAWLAARPARDHLVLAMAPLALLLLTRDETLVRQTGVLVGVLVGFWVERRTIQLGRPGTPTNFLVRYLLGFLGVVLLYTVPRQLLPPIWWVASLRYALLGLWLTWWAPWLFAQIERRR